MTEDDPASISARTIPLPPFDCHPHSMKLGIILGSPRAHSNAAAVVRTVEGLLARRHPEITVDSINLVSSPGHPLPLVLEDKIPAAHNLDSLPDAYADPAIHGWSKTVLSWDGVLVVTPQYNWGPPAPLKNAIDHLFKEWARIPAAIMTLGGHGGSKCHASLQEIMRGGLKMMVIEEGVQISLPREYIVTGKRLEAGDAVLEENTDEIVRCLDALVRVMAAKHVM